MHHTGHLDYKHTQVACVVGVTWGPKSQLKVKHKLKGRPAEEDALVTGQMLVEEIMTIDVV